MSRLTDPIKSFVRTTAVTIEPGCSALEALELALSSGVHHLVVGTSDTHLGVVCTCDLYTAPLASTVERVFTSDPVSLEGTKPAQQAIELMNTLGVGSVLVTTGARPDGFVTRGDLLDQWDGPELARWRCECCGSSEHVETNRHQQTLCLDCRERATEPRHFDTGGGA